MKNDFASVIRLVLHRGSAQGILFLSTLFAAKFATPDTFGEVGLFTSICSFASMISSLRMEVRGLVCRSEGSREKFFGLAYASNVFFFSVFMLVIGALVAFYAFPAWVWLLPMGMFLSSLIQNVIPAQQSSYQHLSRLGWMNQVVAVVTSACQAAAALFVPTAVALIGARVLGWLAGCLLLKDVVASGLTAVGKVDRRTGRRMLRTAGEEMGYGVLASVVSVVTLQVPVYAFWIYARGAEAGLYWLSFSLLFVPYLIISSSIRPVFLRRASLWRGNVLAYDKLRRLTLYSFVGGCAIASALAAACWLVAGTLLPHQWRGVGPFVLALAPLICVLIAQTPISFSISVFGLQRVNLIGGVVQLVGRFVAMVTVLHFTHDPVVALAAFSAVSVLIYAAYIFYCLGKIRRHVNFRPVSNASRSST